MVSERSLAVLHAIVSDYVSSNEPVGSKAIVDRHQFGVSAATIRNDMALLEDDELIAQPHTSSGRVPTDKGYRLYVDTLASVRPLTGAQRAAIERFLGESTDLHDVMARTVRLLSQLTNQVAVAQYPSLRRTVVRHIDLVAIGEDRVLCVLILGSGVVEQQVAWLPASQVTEAWVHGLRERIAEAAVGADVEAAAAAIGTLTARISEWSEPGEADLVRRVLDVVGSQLSANRTDRIAVAGAANVSRPGEFQGALPVVLEAIEEQVTLLRLFDELVQDGRDVTASIGRENLAYGLSAASVLASSYEEEGATVAKLGVLGPMRMDYAGNIAAVRAVARYLNRFLGEER
ncbi:heat-inducible transcriptional repressor HrcA [Leucobacter luti]|uniref:Heat-inducible transcription repressor HrcA n=1 Tax=Leucobacter luti TaxID=340320 RepID=A0A4R6RTJ8_9MICO|nr:heat-inducible transcriptional repressor HrcA [Leucobacter luti]MCW2287953.1 heat-inducible transcriptional repressor [Leucobacter luti]QYM76052.1 heat-inducible transcriptional repressor HrcA [Leucobacter luti]TCK45885.1 heat-inducible transcription repressor HrcA [Leucobacter luti]TDP90221.1 heat-inducible transcription repressor HrcA [Leucobacter luti]